MNTNSKTSLFLMELIIVILFFSIASVVCVQLFVNAFNTNSTTKEESQSVVVIQNIAEGIYGCGGDLKALGELFGSDGRVQIDEANAAMYLFFDEDWNETGSADNAAYKASVVLKDDDGNPVITTDDKAAYGKTVTASVKVTGAGSDNVIASQDIKCYVPYRLEND